MKLFLINFILINHLNLMMLIKEISPLNLEIQSIFLMIELYFLVQ